MDFSNNPDDIICLLGKNGSGKSNVFKALCYYFKNIGKPYSEDKIIDNSNPYVQKCIISILFDIKLLSIKAEHNEQLNNRFKRIHEYINKTQGYNSIHIEHLELKMIQYRDGTIVWNIDDAIICETIKSVFPLYFIDTRRLDLYTWDKLWEIISDLSSTKPKDDYYEELDKAFSDIFGEKYNLSKDIIENTLNKHSVSFDKYHFDERYKHAFSMRFGGNQFVFDGHSLDYYSDGTSSFTYLKVIVSLIPKISDISCKFPIMLIDEPEIGLHNELISKFIDCLKSVIKNNNAFCMISTHSPKLIVDLNNQSLDYSIYRISRKGLYSVISRMNTSWIKASNHQITVKETECYFVDNIVYVEGETEIQLFNHSKILQLFEKLKKVHFYSFDSNEQRLKSVHSEYLNLGIPYKILLDMDKILQYNNKEKFNYRSDSLLNPLSNKLKEDAEQFKFYKTNNIDIGSKRTRIKKLIKNKYTLVHNKNYINDKNYNALMFEIIDFCNIYNVIVNWSTIEGCIITYENSDLFIDYSRMKKPKHSKQFENICVEPDNKERTILLLGAYDGRNEIFIKPKGNGTIKINKEGDKTSGWIRNWLNYFFTTKIDHLNNDIEKREVFKRYFPQLYRTLQSIENMV